MNMQVIRQNIMKYILKTFSLIYKDIEIKIHKIGDEIIMKDRVVNLIKSNKVAEINYGLMIPEKTSKIMKR